MCARQNIFIYTNIHLIRMAIYVQMCVWRYMYKCAGSNIYIYIYVQICEWRYMYKRVGGDICTNVRVAPDIQFTNADLNTHIFATKRTIFIQRIHSMFRAGKQPRAPQTGLSCSAGSRKPAFPDGKRTRGSRAQAVTGHDASARRSSMALDCCQ